MGKPSKSPWTEEEDRSLFKLYKTFGSKWSAIAKELEGRSENEVKNRFYSTLRRIATKKAQDQPIKVQQRKATLLQYVDDAFEYGHSCTSKRGRKKKKAGNDQSSDEAVFKPFPQLSPPSSFVPTSAPLPNYHSMLSIPEASQNVALPSTGYISKFPQEPFTAHSATDLEGAGPGLGLQTMVQNLVLLQQNCINLLRQQFWRPLSKGGSAFVPYCTQRKLE